MAQVKKAIGANGGGRTGEVYETDIDARVAARAGGTGGASTSSNGLPSGMATIGVRPNLKAKKGNYSELPIMAPRPASKALSHTPAFC